MTKKIQPKLAYVIHTNDAVWGRLLQGMARPTKCGARLSLWQLPRSEKVVHRSATQEISRNVQQAATGTLELSANVKRTASDTRGTAGQVLTAARQLTLQAEELTGEVGRFIASVKAA